MSARALGGLVQVSDDVIYAVETAKYPSCRLDLAKALDQVLDTGGLFERAWPMAFRPDDSDKKGQNSEKGFWQGRRPPSMSMRAASWAEVVRHLQAKASALWTVAPCFSAALPPSRL
ncbi:hypothetical protein [Streptomyces sp. HF10]|uniref:hypothetical protein n=1 Tax=Streptomyces sp. HF10 TaxID=2692233 RepID=UPI001F236DED|nr:hypothetical protein [Streptomyces sp. HF10]